MRVQNVIPLPRVISKSPSDPFIPQLCSILRPLSPTPSHLCYFRSLFRLPLLLLRPLWPLLFLHPLTVSYQLIFPNHPQSICRLIPHLQQLTFLRLLHLLQLISRPFRHPLQPTFNLLPLITQRLCPYLLPGNL